MMKKIFMLLIILGLYGCGNQKNIIEDSGSTETGGEVTEDGLVIDSSTITYFGKLTKVVGNEVELSLAKWTTPEGEVEDEAASEGAGEVSGGLTGATGEFDEEALQELLDSGDFIVTEGTDRELEYTGETESFIIPAGVKIMKYGKEIPMSELKEGMVLTVYGTEVEGQFSVIYVEVTE